MAESLGFDQVSTPITWIDGSAVPTTGEAPQGNDMSTLKTIRA